MFFNAKCSKLFKFPMNLIYDLRFVLHLGPTVKTRLSPPVAQQPVVPSCTSLVRALLM